MADFDKRMATLVRGIAAIVVALLAAAWAIVTALLWLAGILTKALKSVESSLRNLHLQFLGKVIVNAPKSDGTEVTIKDEVTTISPTTATTTDNVSAALSALTSSQEHDRPWALEATVVKDDLQRHMSVLRE